MDKLQGIVKWFNQTKGFGFIEPEDKSKDVFVHATAVRSSGLESLQEKQRVEYEIQEDAKGKIMAVNLRALGSPQEQA